jgi:hypothetical protein
MPTQAGIQGRIANCAAVSVIAWIPVSKRVKRTQVRFAALCEDCASCATWMPRMKRGMTFLFDIQLLSVMARLVRAIHVGPSRAASGYQHPRPAISSHAVPRE